MRCMPHTIHLAAIKVPFSSARYHIYNIFSKGFYYKLLEGIGAMSANEGKKASAQGSNYQENMTAPPLNEDDGIASDEVTDDQDAKAGSVLSAIEKVDFCVQHCRTNLIMDKFWQLRKVIKAVRSSPQHRQSWAREIQFIQAGGNSTDCNSSLMLILDVRTRWSSTHQMIRMFQSSSSQCLYLTKSMV